jgi:hypothetical protein
VAFAGSFVLPPALRWEGLGSLVPAWVAPAESGRGLLLRLHEVSGGRGTAILRLARRPENACLVDLFENRLADLPLDADGAVRIPYGPYSILGVLVSAESAPSARDSIGCSTASIRTPPASG